MRSAKVKKSQKNLLRIHPRGKAPTHTIEVPPPEDPVVRASSHGGWIYREHEAFLRSIRTGSRPAVDVETGWWATAVGIAAERAVAEGRIVEMSELTGPE
jgi:predicted dehydrogenase